jgi:hypothetical protein
MLLAGRVVAVEQREGAKGPFAFVDVRCMFTREVVRLQVRPRDLAWPADLQSWEDQNLVAFVRLDRPYQDQSKVQLPFGSAGNIWIGPDAPLFELPAALRKVA